MGKNRLNAIIPMLVIAEFIVDSSLTDVYAYIKKGKWGKD